MSETDLQPAAQTTTPAVTDVASMLLPVAGKQLLMPGVSVAEIVNYSYVERPDDVPDWLFGHITWRKLSVPLVSFELLNGQAMPRMTSSRRIAVLNNTGVSEELPFIAIVIQGIPRLMRVTPRDIGDDESAPGPAELAAVRLASGETVYIPDVGVLERTCQAWLAGR